MIAARAGDVLTDQGGGRWVCLGVDPGDLFGPSYVYLKPAGDVDAMRSIARSPQTLADEGWRPEAERCRA